MLEKIYISKEAIILYSFFCLVTYYSFCAIYFISIIILLQGNIFSSRKKGGFTITVDSFLFRECFGRQKPEITLIITDKCDLKYSGAFIRPEIL